MTDQQNYFTEKQREMLNKYIDFYRSLDYGKRIPDSPAQKHFVLACRGQAPIQTEHEYIYIRHRNLNYRRQKFIEQLSSYQQRANQKIQIKHTSNHYKNTVIPSKSYKYKESTIVEKFNKCKKVAIINENWKQAERENISRTLLRQKRISKALVTYSD